MKFIQAPVGGSPAKLFRKYGSIVAGAGILAFGIYNVHSRCAISEGGVLGLSLLLYQWPGISPGISGLILDSAAIVAGTLILKKTFLTDSIIASVCYALWYALLECFDPLLPDLSPWPPAAAVAGGIFIGVGTTLIVRQGCAAGADDSFALIMLAKTRLRLGTIYLISDLSVLLLSLTYIPPGKLIWSFLSVGVSSGLIALLCPRDKNEDERNGDKHGNHGRSGF